MSLCVLHPGACSLLVDHGRPGSRSLGVPVGGAADRFSWQFGNSLIGNDPESLALEVSLSGPRLRAETSVGCVVFGAPFDLWRDGCPLPANRSFTLEPGQELAIGGTGQGLRAYLCVCGGFDAPTILESRTGLEPIKVGDRLACPASRIGGRYPALSTWQMSTEPTTIRITPGLQRDWFDISAFLSHTFTVSPASNRMGLRLTGPTLTVPQKEMTSEPVCPGSIQVTRDGQCIVLGIDGQTIGGYPKIGQVITPDLDVIAQLRPGSAIRFQEISYEEARAIFLGHEADLHDSLIRTRASLDSTLTRRTLLEEP